MRQRSKTRSIVLCGLSIALLAVGAFVTVPVPFGLTPFTLQTLALFIILMILSPAEAVIAVAGYLALGALGLPIFSGMTGGFAKLVGPTGGFLIGYLLAAFAVGGLRILAVSRQKKPQILRQPSPQTPSQPLPQSFKKRLIFDVAVILVACLIYFTLGTLWYSVNMGVGMAAACAACVLPFVVTEPIKIVAAIICVQPVRSALGLSVRPPHKV